MESMHRQKNDPRKKWKDMFSPWNEGQRKELKNDIRWLQSFLIEGKVTLDLKEGEKSWVRKFWELDES